MDDQTHLPALRLTPVDSDKSEKENIPPSIASPSRLLVPLPTKPSSSKKTRDVAGLTDRDASQQVAQNCHGTDDNGNVLGDDDGNEIVVEFFITLDDDIAQHQEVASRPFPCGLPPVSQPVTAGRLAGLRHS